MLYKLYFGNQYLYKIFVLWEKFIYNYWFMFNENNTITNNRIYIKKSNKILSISYNIVVY